MTLVLQIVVLLVVLVGLITTIMSVKNWHWAQMLLLLGIFFSAIGVLFLGMEVYRIHRNLRAGMPNKLKQIEEVEAENFALRRGTRNPDIINRVFVPPTFAEGVPYDAEAEGRMPGLEVWKNRLQDLARDRGRVWRNVKATGPVDPATGRIPAAIPEPKPHGLDEGAIVFGFEQNASAPDQNPQYLGEFKVVESREDGVTLESVQRLDNRTGGRLVRSAQNPQVTWRLYETMPSDRHELFAGKSEEELKKMLPAASVTEYLRHGKEVTPDDDKYHRAAFDEKERRVALDAAEKVTERFDRPLRDYAYLFSELLRQRVLLQADKAGLTEDNTRLKAAQENALQLTAHRTQELEALDKDRESMQRDREAIEKLRDAVLAQLANARQMVAELIPANAQAAEEWMQAQLARLRDVTTAAPSGAELTGAGQ